MSNFSRREILTGSVATLVTGSLVSRFAPASTATRPNILWLVSEDNSPLIGAYGDNLARTPVIDALARRGLTYRHAYANAPVCALSRFGILTGVYPESCAPANHMRATARVAGILKGYPQYLREAGYYCTNNEKTDYNCDLDPQQIWNESSTSAHWRNRPAGTPFMAVFNCEVTHEGEINQPIEGRVKPEAVRVPTHLPDTPAMRRDIASHYNLIERMDRLLGARLAELKADGLMEDTIIFYYSDHGGVSPRSKRFCYEEGLRACLIIALPSKYAHLAPQPMGTEVSTPVSFIDLAPTVLALAGIARPSQMAGRALLGNPVAPRDPYVFGARDRMDERYDMTRTVTDGRHRYIRNYTPHRPWGQHYSYAWLNQGYQDWERRYRAGQLNTIQARFFGPKPYEELYDLAVDPEQTTNLVGLSEQRPRLQTLRAALDEHMLAINDNGFIPEGSPLEGYHASRITDVYPLKAIMRVASAAAKRDAAELAAFQAGLTHPDEVIRYWSAQGLLMLGRHARPARSALRRAMSEDASAHVRVVAAEALASLGEAQEPVSVLVQLLDHAIYPVRLQAINALTFIGPAARAALPAIDRVIAEENPEGWTVHCAAMYLSRVLRGQYDPADPIFDWKWMNQWWARRARK